MSSLTVFQFESSNIRFVDGKPVANDVAAILGYADPSKTISTKVSNKNKGVTEMVTPGGVQSVTVLEEPGIYQLIFSSKMSSAEKFQDWVFEEVLPSLRKTGKYEIQPEAQTVLKQYTLMEVAERLESVHKSTLPAAVKQLLIDGITDEQLTKKQIAIAPTKERYLGAAQKAEELGYKLDQSSRTRLGKFIKAQGLEPSKEERLVNGQMRLINVYLDSDKLAQAIETFFN